MHASIPETHVASEYWNPMGTLQIQLSKKSGQKDNPVLF